jgi:hypothetical protein
LNRNGHQVTEFPEFVMIDQSSFFPFFYLPFFLSQHLSKKLGMGSEQSVIPPPAPAASSTAELNTNNLKVANTNNIPSACPMHQKANASTTTTAAPHPLMGSTASSSACPVKHGKTENPAPSVASTSTDLPIECPVKHSSATSTTPNVKKYQNPNVYNVYNQVIDPKNQMPANANQQPAPDQREVLSTQREQSTIPKGGTDSTWLYPSPQMVSSQFNLNVTATIYSSSSTLTTAA